MQQTHAQLHVPADVAVNRGTAALPSCRRGTCANGTAGLPLGLRLAGRTLQHFPDYQRCWTASPSGTEPHLGPVHSHINAGRRNAGLRGAEQDALRAHPVLWHGAPCCHQEHCGSIGAADPRSGWQLPWHAAGEAFASGSPRCVTVCLLVLVRRASDGPDHDVVSSFLAQDLDVVVWQCLIMWCLRSVWCGAAAGSGPRLRGFRFCAWGSSQVVTFSFLGVGAPEALLVAVVALVVFGPKGLAEVSPWLVGAALPWR